MDTATTTALENLLRAAIRLAETSGSKVLVTFNSVAISIDPDATAQSLMEEFERMQLLNSIVVPLSTMFCDLFSSSELRSLVRFLPECKTYVPDFPSQTLSVRDYSTAMAILLLSKRTAFEDTFWAKIRSERPRRIEDCIQPVEELVRASKLS
jgi:hypothetical protein